MNELKIPAHEQGTTRVFALSLTAEQARSLRDTPLLQKGALGVEGLTLSGIEIFALSDLGDMGLAGYLREGVDANQDDLNRDRAKLAALDGWVMLVHSSAFEGRATTLETASALTLIGTYSQTSSETTALHLEAEAAQPYSGVGAGNVEPATTNRANGSLVIVALVLIASAVLWWGINK
ncbi:MAG: hypothetical protein ABJL67_00535 [Sulfitobacter sp.]